MKKISLIVLSLLLLSACGSKKAALYEEKVKLYQSYWTSIQDQTKYQAASNNFSIAGTISSDVLAKAEGDDSTTPSYQYDIVIDKARIAMYDVEILVLEGEEAYHDEKMMPSLGIFDDANYHLVPNQSRPEKSYQSGFKLSGETEDLELSVHVIVTWKNYARSEMFKEFFEIKPKQGA